ncbi:virulence protein SciE type [Chitinimonas arctica]|uniref:Virulence protein SciE type n=1 Tax=Chitinimonas arctica TaxID=2594795 RepID=A0A516SH80_9NEIS|nr:type VI secretion system accessory protein TagJ [Chitinimonas arctica]QDQ27513.1 virulence protein SciE type [Chitinimonas arctica]
MTVPSNAEALIKQGCPTEALEALQAEVRRTPAAPEPRVFLFQLLAILGDWQRAGQQLDTLSKLYGDFATFTHFYQHVLTAERARADVFAGQASPVVIGDPSPWLAQMIEALRLDAGANHAAAASLRAEALEQAPAHSGHIDDQPFAWLADGDSRLGPVLEVIVKGQYRWLPMERLIAVELEKPESLADLVWLKAELYLAGGQQTPALVPVRYPGSTSAGAPLAMARATRWLQPHSDTWFGLGQREFASDVGEHALLDTRVIRFDTVEN